MDSKKSIDNLGADYFDNLVQKGRKPSLAQRLSQGSKHHAAKRHHHNSATLLQQASLMTTRSRFAADDLFHEEDNEDAEIMKSIAYAEAKLGKKFDTP